MSSVIERHPGSTEPIPRGRATALLAASGACLVLAFPPIGFLPAAFVALVPFIHVLRRSRPTGFWSAFRPGLTAGVVFFGLLLYWLVFLSSQQMDNPVLMSGPLVLLVLFQACFWGLFSAGCSLAAGRGRVPWVLVVPLVWVAVEQLRSLGVLGFTWGAVGYAGITLPRAIQFASTTGVFGVSFWIVLANALVYEVLRPALSTEAGGRERGGLSGLGRSRLRSRGPAAAAAALVIVILLPVLHGSLVLDRLHGDRTIRVAVVQPNIEGKKKWDPAYKSLSFETLEELTLEVAAESPDLIIWPETATPSYLLRRPEDLALVASIARRAGAPILAGCPDLEPHPSSAHGYTIYNSVVLIDTAGVVRGKYDKMHLVPFGEVIPFETVLPFLRRVDFGEADFAPGEEPVVLETEAGRFVALICFEAIFPRLVRGLAAEGTDLLVNVTNDVWYGRTSMPFQHASMALMRTIENRRSLARSANSGVSLLADPAGRVVASLGIFERGALAADLPIVSATSFYARHGDVFPWCVSALAAVLLVLSAVRPPRGIRPRVR